MESKKKHWETVYETKNPNDVSWTQDVPKISLELIRTFAVDKNAEIIDVGGGDSNLVDYLIAEGYQNITVLDISEKALEKAKIRLGKSAEMVTWIVCDILDFDPKTKYEIWHDRAAFHFLTDTNDINKYQSLVSTAANRFLVIGTFSEQGPKKCSALDVTQYNEEKLSKVFAKNFELKKCFYDDHETPFGTKQNFLFCSFKRK